MRAPATACALALTVSLAAPPLPAARSDRDEVAEIYAERVHIDQQQQTSRYQGKVEFTQGSVRITGDEVLLGTGDGALRMMDVRGAPATFRERDDAGRALRARARHIVYNADTTEIRLQGDAELCRGGEYFRSEFIEYNSDTGAVRAGRDGASEQERVHITLRPQPSAQPDNCDQMP